MSAPSDAPAPSLTRQLGLWSAVAVLVGSTIGSGIFRSPAGIADKLPGPLPLMSVWVAGGLFALCGALTLAELCQHAHLQARSLEYGFRDLVGLSPFKYIKMLRLGEVRRRLQASSPAERSVSEVALDCGFCHLSQFAADYKRVFLESPSATRRAIGRSRPSRPANYEAGPAAFAAR